MRYKENFKKGMVRLIISTGISYKKLSELTTISQPTLKKWDDEYRQECLDEKKRETERLKKQEEENMRCTAWHQYGSGTDSLMANALGNSFVAWSAWEQIRRLTCVACGKKYVRQLTEDDHAEEVCEEICQTIYDIAMMRKKDGQNGEA